VILLQLRPPNNATDQGQILQVNFADPPLNRTRTLMLNRARNVKCLTITTISLLLSGCGASTPSQPPTEPLIKIVFRNATPGIDTDSFAAKPKTLYLLGSHYQRLEELPDFEAGIHGLIVSNERDTWMVNLANKTGKHIVDNATNYDIYAPVVSDRTDSFEGFNFGFELSYMEDAGVKPTQVRLGDRDLVQYEYSKGQMQLRLMVSAKEKIPYAAGLFDSGKLMHMVRYEEYKVNLEPEPTLFEKPSGISYTEANVD